MELDITEGLNRNRLNAYSASKYRWSTIKVTEGTIIATNMPNRLTESIDDEIEPDKLGGIIVFSDEINAVKMADNKLVNWIKQKAATINNKISRSKKIDDIAQRHDLFGWTVGKFLRGRYTGKDGKVYSENSLSVEVVGVDFDTLISIAEDLCRAFNQESVLVKVYGDPGRILFVNGD